MRIVSSDVSSHKDKQVTMAGWVHSRRDHGGLIFIDLRDHQGLTQLTIRPEVVENDVFGVAESLRDEYVIEVVGTVKQREAELRNSNIVSGDVEVIIEQIRILNKAEPLPIQVNNEELSSEETRLKYRYLDLRRPKMQYMLQRRAQMYQIIRRYMEAENFTEIATPILANSSPEGARDFVIPSRFHPGNFYALPQAPQQFKQLLMVGGVHRYYQFAACFRDEDPRADRLYGEFYQLDMEMSFVEDGEEVRSIIDPLITDLVKDFGKKQLLGDNLPRITYAEAMEKFGSDKPDLRFDMQLVDLTEDLRGCEFGVFSRAIDAGGAVKALCASKTFSRSQIDKLTEQAKRDGGGGLPYMVVENGQATGAIAKFFSDDQKAAIVDKMQANDGDTIFFGSDDRAKVNKILGNLRSKLGDILELKDPNVVSALWVIDFPFYEWDEKANKLDFGHNPFSMPKGGAEALDSEEDKLKIVADQYDLVINGYECASGAVRNHNPEVMYKVFDVLGYDKHYVEAKFGAMLNAFKYGAPPHAGCAPGLDRIFMILMGEDNIREIVAFPKNGSGVDLMMQSPSEIDQTQLKELGL